MDSYCVFSKFKKTGALLIFSKLANPVKNAFNPITKPSPEMYIHFYAYYSTREHAVIIESKY